jgi:protein SCO1/2
MAAEAKRPETRDRAAGLALLRIVAVSAGGGAALALAVAALLWLGGGERKAAMPVIGLAPRYMLVDQNNKPVSSQEFAGRVRVVAPLFPYCRELCPLVAANLAEFDDHVVRPSDLNGHVVFVFFNLAPADAGPPAMRQFLQQYGWNPDTPAVEFLTGSPDAIRRVVEQGYHIAYYRTEGDANDEGASLQVVNALADRVKPNFDIKHADIIELVDGGGRIRKIFTDGSRVGDMRLRAAIVPLLTGRPS